ncbi:wd-40 repeat-containing protein : WD-40 repeat protein OS=Pirellula staleyi (strain ATCC 27377 / DSM 6068 / ICPB 4128) GN=Psta_1602 PE=4 SV=1: WD40: WD40: WD40 [Gemmataceae bacterium]|nr:wd-40 repeat-containing protein : WD-40 repeat protein OS=Pirellula staleyi (strain ATCC 27377 / DSM 6068 / ICPB 4128) GN=Psta_1602 PE=4 SV=1: WD40: WD40: WD40 [Gemmataceae bacterium]VTT98604.1 wd-40 repeat-containing protein : WD-40 repeat protein OS=Pirellula staleyi (strain ATCC 27377 / DSM 6068 / ICPB 4128) GN=Psta_1602 PE=4 SV=1: WD40: WD40: WD40 [Gemmataceae bacterium]
MTTQPPKKDTPANAPKELGKPLVPPVQVSRVRFSPDGTLLVAACFDGTVRRWDVSGKEPVELPAITGHNGWVTNVMFMSLPPKIGDKIYSTDSWGRLTASDIDGKQRWTVESAHDGWVRGLAQSPDKAVVATCGKDGIVRLWRAATGKPDIKFKLGSDLLSLAFAPDGTDLFVGDQFGVVHVLNYASGEPVRTIEARELFKLDRIQDVGGVKNLMLSADGKTLFAAGAEPKSGGFVQCVPLLIAFDRSGKRLSQYKGANDNEGYVTDLAWHPDGYVIGTTSGQPGQGKFFFWKPGDAAAFVTGGKHPNCHSVALAPEGDVMAVSATNANSSGNGRVKGTGGDYPANNSPIQLWTVPKA